MKTAVGFRQKTHSKKSSFQSTKTFREQSRKYCTKDDDGLSLQEKRFLKMKALEKETAQSLKVSPGIPYIVRLDGHSFGSFTKGFNKPCDERSI